MVLKQTNCSNKDYALIHKDKKKKYEAGNFLPGWHNQEKGNMKLSAKTGTSGGKPACVSLYNSQLLQVHNDASLGEPEYFISSYQSQRGS